MILLAMVAVTGLLFGLYLQFIDDLPTRNSASPGGGSASEAPAAPSDSPSATAAPSDEPSGDTLADRPPPAEVGDRAVIRIPKIGVKRTTVFYNGGPDDRPGTRIQDTGRLAASLGSKGGVGPGEIGNLIITGHRISHGGPLRKVPELRKGDHVLVSYAGKVYDYEITGSLWIDFHDPESYALQVAPVPGHPGRKATKPMITVSTCATPEDIAAGLTDFDELGNPPHRIDKIGVLVDVRSA